MAYASCKGSLSSFTPPDFKTNTWLGDSQILYIPSSLLGKQTLPVRCSLIHTCCEVVIGVTMDNSESYFLLFVYFVWVGALLQKGYQEPLE